MPEQNTAAPDLDKIAAALEKMAETPNANRKPLLKDQLSEPRMKAAILKAKQAHYSNAEIGAFLADQGIKISPSTFARYWQQIESEGRSEGDAKPRRGRKATKAAKPAGSEEVKATAKPEDSKPQSEGKRLSKSPGMGGAFDQDNL